MTEITRILSQIERGDPNAADELLPLVYDELRRLAASNLSNERPGQTLQATALVHEAYIRLVDANEDHQWNSRGHFFGAAAKAMRRLLVERARRHQSQKRGGNWIQVELSERDLITVGTPDQIVALNEAMESLAQEEPDATELVQLVLFGGLPVEKAGQILEMSRATAFRHWAYARAWLTTEIADYGVPTE